MRFMEKVGDLPQTYQIRGGDIGPSHLIIRSICLGLLIRGEMSIQSWFRVMKVSKVQPASMLDCGYTPDKLLRPTMW